MCAYGPFPINEFAGLDLSSDVDETGGAADLLNVEFDRQGSIRSRDGTSVFASPAGATTIPRMRPFYRTSADQLMAHYTISGGSKVAALNTSGTVASQAMSSSAAVVDFAPTGTPAAQRCYACDSGGPMFRWDGSTFTSVTGSPQCSYVAATADNRLLAANIATLPSGSGAASASSSLVHFSDPGAPETWSANNYVYLTPGDGDPIKAVVAWRELVFVFKRFRFFVFTNTSIDSTGNPVFNYRMVDTHVGTQSPFSAVAAPEGVYFAAADGIYVTTGGTPQRISAAITPWFTGQLSPYWRGSGTSSSTWGDGTDPAKLWGSGTGTDVWGGGVVSDVRLAYANGRLYCFSNGGNDCFVYIAAQQTWTYWSFAQPNYSMVGYQPGGSGVELLFLGQPSNVMKVDTTQTTDNGAAISSRYRSGFMAMNYIHRSAHGTWLPITSQEGTVREAILNGTGTVNFSISRDYQRTVPTVGGGATTSVRMGTSPISGPGRSRVAQRGRAVSWQVDSTSAWSLNALVLHIRGARVPGIQTAVQ